MFQGDANKGELTAIVKSQPKNPSFPDAGEDESSQGLLSNRWLVYLPTYDYDMCANVENNLIIRRTAAHSSKNHI